MKNPLLNQVRSDRIEEAAQEAYKAFEKVPKGGGDFPKGNPTPDQWDEIADRMGDLGDALSKD